MKKIGKYEICGLLGRGGMGKVYKARIPVINKICAVKALDPHPHLISVIGEPELRNLFTSEAVTMADLRHPNLLEVWDFHCSDDLIFYTMEYYCNNLGTLIGETYQAEIPSRIISIDKIIHYMNQVLEGLKRLHHDNIIHRDIKPYNVLITDQDTVKICDFGLSKTKGKPFPGPSHLKVGSPWYSAPEQERKPDDADFTADIYSFGVMLYRLLTGNMPFETMVKPSALNPKLDENWDELIESALAPNPEDRMQTVDEVAGGLAELKESWDNKKDRICNLEEPAELIDIDPIIVKRRLRSRPMKVRPKDAYRIFKIDDLFRPLEFSVGEFRADMYGTVTDPATDLVWQQSGSDYPMTWYNAHHYIEQLNRNHVAGYDTWRLPTVEELMSLLTNTVHEEDYCMEPIFDDVQKWIWSSDKRSYIAAWYVNYDLGFVSWQDFTCRFYVKGVCEGNLT